MCTWLWVHSFEGKSSFGMAVKGWEWQKQWNEMVHQCDHNADQGVFVAAAQQQTVDDTCPRTQVLRTDHPATSDLEAQMQRLCDPEHHTALQNLGLRVRFRWANEDCGFSSVFFFNFFARLMKTEHFISKLVTGTKKPNKQKNQDACEHHFCDFHSCHARLLELGVDFASTKYWAYILPTQHADMFYSQLTWCTRQ